MAESNVIPPRVSKDKNHYMTRPLSENASMALEMSKEIQDKRERLYCLASVLESHLAPSEGECSDNPMAWRISELLEEMLGQCGLEYRLNDCIEAIKTQAMAGVVPGEHHA